MEQIPLTVIFHYGVMSGPSYYGCQYLTLVYEGSVRIVADCVAKQMAVARRIREIILSVVLMHPRGLKETVRVVGLKRLSIIIHYQDGTWLLRKLKHILGQTDTAAWKRGLVAFRKVGAFEGLVVLIALKLASP